MELLNDFIQNYGLPIIGLLLTALFSYLGLFIKSKMSVWLQDKQVASIANVVVLATEQMWKDLHGEDKLNQALKDFSILLAEKGIHISDAEMRLHIEAAVAAFNKSVK